MKAQNKCVRGKRKFTQIVLSVVLVLISAPAVSADLVFDSGHNTFDDSYPYYDEVWVIKDAVLDITGGSIGKLELLDTATVNLYDVVISYRLATMDNSSIYIYGGTFDKLGSWEDSSVYLYAYDVTYHPTGGTDEHGWIEGKYLNNNLDFSFSFDSSETYQHITIIPEPTTVLLLGFGYLLMIRLKKK